jgi:hypothetical protein
MVKLVVHIVSNIVCEKCSLFVMIKQDICIVSNMITFNPFKPDLERRWYRLDWNNCGYLQRHMTTDTAQVHPTALQVCKFEIHVNNICKKNRLSEMPG